ncbi:MAG TPA: hypothetical protein VEC94_15800 [Pseudolabrys sp.]|nr:hypothetical protein [Pseudolabrys sp.]
MSDKRTTPDPAVAAGRPKRSAPTIDLTASEVSSDGPHVAADHPVPESDSPQEQSAGAHETGAGRWVWPAAQIGWQPFAAGFAGAAIMMITLFVLWSLGLVPARYDNASGADSQSITALNERVGKVESATAKIPGDSKVSEHLTAADNAMKSLGIALAGLNRRTDDVAARVAATEKTLAELRDNVRDLAKNASASLSQADVDTVQKRLGVLEQATKTANNDNAARLALSAAALRDAVAGGMPFNIELDEAKALGADDKTLAPLVPFAANGVPSAAALGHELHELIPAMQKISGVQAPKSSFLERLEANAEKLVRIRPVGAPVGDDASAVLARLEIESAKADISGALADLGKLDGAVRAQAQDWIVKVQARQAALAASRQFAAETARALGKQ